MNLSNRSAFLTKGAVVCGGAFFCCALWGSAFPCIKIGYQLFQIPSSSPASQILFAGIRFLLAGLMTILLGSVLEKRFIFPRKKSCVNILKLSSLQTVGQYVLFYIGLSHTSGVRASIVEATNVFVAILISSLLFHQEKLTWAKIVGCILGFSGVLVINLSGSSLGDGSLLQGDLLIFLSTFCYAFSSVLLKSYSKGENPITLSGYQFAIGGLCMMLGGFLIGGKITVVTENGILMLLYLAFISAAAYTVWGILLKYNPISRVAIYGFMNPVVGVVLSTLLLHESSAGLLPCLLALLLISAGICLTNRPGRSKSAS